MADAWEFIRDEMAKHSAGVFNPDRMLMSGPKHNIVVFADGWSENDNFTPSRDLTSETAEGQAQLLFLKTLAAGQKPASYTGGRCPHSVLLHDRSTEYNDIPTSWSREEAARWQAALDQQMQQECNNCGSNHITEHLRGRPYMAYVEWHEFKSAQLGWRTLALSGCTNPGGKSCAECGSDPDQQNSSAVALHPHPLKARNHPSAWICDNCDKRGRGGDVVHSCTACDYDLCPACTKSAAAAGQRLEIQALLDQDIERIERREPQIMMGRPFTSSDGLCLVASSNGQQEEWGALSVDQVLGQQAANQY